MIELAQNSAARQLLNKSDKVQDSLEYDDDFEHVSEDDKVVRSPSMMRMACNLMEVIRLREELILRISECETLTKIYEQQFSMAGRPQKVQYSDSVNFNTSTILKDQINIIDSNHGKNKVFDLPFMEYDNTLAINLDLKKESCIKALMTDLGLEELRGILLYQIMHQHMLQIAVQQNQLVLDGPSKALKELELLERSIVAPNPVLRLDNIISTTSDGQNIAAMKAERGRLKQAISNSYDSLYVILAKKGRDREAVVKKFQKVQTRIVQGQEYKPELCLRILRSYRLKLLHEFCANVLKEVYTDAIKVQTLQTTNILRQKAALLPFQPKNRFFTLGRGNVMENMSAFAYNQLYEESLEEKQTLDVKDILNGQIINSSLFYIPHSEEIIATDRVIVEQVQQRQNAWLEHIETDFEIFDQQIKTLVVRPTMLDETF